MKVYEYLAQSIDGPDPDRAIAEVGNIEVHLWKRDDSTIVIDSIKIVPNRWELSDDLLIFTIHAHDTQKPKSQIQMCWEVRPSLIKGLKANWTNEDENVEADWIGENLLNALRSTKR
jgi:hypothetical protein